MSTNPKSKKRVQRKKSLLKVFLQNIPEANVPAGFAPTFNGALAWLCRHCELINTGLRLIQMYPYLIKEGCLDGLWNFLLPLLQSCSEKQELLDNPCSIDSNGDSEDDTEIPSISAQTLEPTLGSNYTSLSKKDLVTCIHSSHSHENLTVKIPPRCASKSPAGKKTSLLLGQKKTNVSHPGTTGLTRTRITSAVDSRRQNEPRRTDIKLPPLPTTEPLKRKQFKIPPIQPTPASQTSHSTPSSPSELQLNTSGRLSSKQDIETSYLVFRGHRGRRSPELVQWPPKGKLRRESWLACLDDESESSTFIWDSQVLQDLDFGSGSSSPEMT